MLITKLYSRQQTVWIYIVAVHMVVYIVTVAVFVIRWSIMHKIDDVFKYLNTFETKEKQMSLFNIGQET